ncbi:MAG: hypothetical protein HY720_32730 [Planctomycetes bacterium]|nr:hypothetical protein [Planctomycetota bacterium]
MAKDQDKQLIRAKKREFLAALKKEGKIRAPKDAHKALTKKFGSSLTYSEFGEVWRGDKPRKRAGGRKKTGRRSGAAKPSRPSRPNAERGDAEYAILAPGKDPILAKSRPEVVRRVMSLLKQGGTPDGLSLYRRVDLKIQARYKIKV